MEGVWHGRRYQDFRQKIADGIFPDETCEVCYKNTGARPLSKDLGHVWSSHIRTVSSALGPYLQTSHIMKLGTLIDVRQADEDFNPLIQQIRSEIRGYRKLFGPGSKKLKTAFRHLDTLAAIVASFLNEDLLPPIVAPYRLVNLLSTCNARCIHCVGMYASAKSDKMMGNDHLDEALSNPEHVVSFSMVGTEFLYYPAWQEIGAFLAENGISFVVSTNGILLTPENIRFLIDKEIVSTLNISFDGAEKNTVEAIRRKVSFPDLVENLRYLFSYASERSYRFQLILSMVLMKRNFRELPGLIGLLHETRNGFPYPPDPYIHCQSLNYVPSARNYMKFYRKEHYGLADRDELNTVFHDALKVSRETQIKVVMFTEHLLQEFVDAGCPTSSFVSET